MPRAVRRNLLGKRPARPGAQPSAFADARNAGEYIETSTPAPVHREETQTLPLGGADPLVERFRRELAEARERTLRLVAPVADADLDRVHSPLMSPLVWDLGHIAAFEDLWLCQRGAGLEPLRPELMAVYDASETPRADRGDIPYLRRAEALEYMAAVRERALDVLARADLSPGSDRLNAGGFVWEMLIQHEHQHNETMLQTLALADQGVYSPEPRPVPGLRAAPTGVDRRPRRDVRDGRRRRGLRLRQRAAAACRRRACVPDHGAGR